MVGRVVDALGFVIGVTTRCDEERAAILAVEFGFDLVGRWRGLGFLGRGLFLDWLIFRRWLLPRIMQAAQIVDERLRVDYERGDLCLIERDHGGHGGNAFRFDGVHGCLTEYAEIWIGWAAADLDGVGVEDEAAA